MHGSNTESNTGTWYDSYLMIHNFKMTHSDSMTAGRIGSVWIDSDQNGNFERFRFEHCVNRKHINKHSDELEHPPIPNKVSYYMTHISNL